MHIVWTMANNSTVPYFTWFADQLIKDNKHKLTFIILYPHKPEILEEMLNKGITCYWIPFNEQHRIKSYLYALPKLYTLLKQLKPDVLHAHLFDDALPALIAARMARVKLRVITKADAGFHWNYSRKAVPFDILNNTNANLIVALSSENKTFITTKEKAVGKKITIIHHGIPDILQQVDTNIKQEFVNKYQLEGKLVLGMISRLIEWKGVMKVLEQIPVLIKTYPHLKLLICGDGPQKQSILSFIESNALTQHVVLTGKLDKGSIPSLYAVLDGFIHFATLEPFGLVISEAMMCATPVVCTPTGAAADAVVHKENGFIVPYNDYGRLGEGVQFILHHKNKISANARITALDLFTSQTMYKNHISAYMAYFNKSKLS